MIISASRRTDIPAFFSQWFYHRIREGFVHARNPMNPRSVARIRLDRPVVDGFVFWTKNPGPMLAGLDVLNPYPYYFHVTINAYGPDIERCAPRREKEIVPAFQRLSDRIGPGRVIWRYDPILLSQACTVDHHLDGFDMLARQLAPYTSACVISFVDAYRNTRRHAEDMRLQPIPPETAHMLAAGLAARAKTYGIALSACSEAEDFARHGILPATCIDGGLLSHIGGVPLEAQRDKNQRPACRCVTSIDIGAYNTCGNGCQYCYANYNETRVRGNLAAHDPASSLLVGRITAGDKVYDRAIRSFRGARGQA